MKKLPKEKNIKRKDIRKMSIEEYEDLILSNRLKPHRMTFHQREVLQNDFMRRTIVIKNFPSSIARQCALSALSKIKGTTFSMHTSPLHEAKANQLINRQINNKTAQRINSKKKTDQLDAEADEQAIVGFYQQLQEDKSKIFLTNIFIEFYGKDTKELNNKEMEISNILSGYKITYDILRFEQKEGFAAVQPLGKDNFKSLANNIPSRSLANLYPFSFSNRNDPQGLFLGETDDGGYVFLDFLQKSEDITNGNYSIIGIPGMGKTWLQKKIISQMIFNDKTVMILDPDRDYIELITRLGGTVFDCASGKVKINPFEVRRLMTDTELEEELKQNDDGSYIDTPEAFRQSSTFYQHLSWLKEFYTVLFPDITPQELDALMILTHETYRNKGIEDKTDFDTLQSTDYPTFTDLYNHAEACSKLSDDFYNHISKQLFHSILLKLRDTYDGALGYLFNGYTNIKNDKMICFDLNALLSGSKNRLHAVIFNIMTYVWNRISKRSERILFAVDELSLLLDRNNPIIAQYLRDFNKRARKYGAIIGTSTQQIEDVDDPNIRHITRPLLSNTSFKFAFYPDNSGLSVVQDVLKLTDGEIGCISKPKLGYCLLKAGDNKYYMHVGELPYEKALFGKLSG